MGFNDGFSRAVLKSGQISRLMSDNEQKMPPEQTDLDPELGVDLENGQGQADPVAGEDGRNDPGAPMTEIAQTSFLKRAVDSMSGAKSSAKAKPAARPVPAGKKPPVPQKAPPRATPSGAPRAEMPPGPLVHVVMRNEYYRDGFYHLLKIALVEAVVIVGMILCFLFYMNMAQPEDRYFATTADGRIMRLVPLDQPNMTVPALMSWVAQAATDVMTFGFHDYQRRLQDASQHFTRRGWESFTSALQKSRIIDAVETAQQVVTAAPRSAPVLVQEGVINGRYRWVVELPLMITYRAGNQSRTDNMQVTIVVERMPSLENPIGVGIEQWIAR